MADISDLKKTVFFKFIEIAGRAYILVRHSESVIIGRRGFLPEEMEKGLVLVLNEKMNFTWDDRGISANLVFGSSSERCFIPSDDIVAIYSPELGAQFLVSAEDAERGTVEGREEAEAAAAQGSRKDSDKVIRVDFKKRR
ncbi:MAG: ClpXP protease specificity-enhancing factor SspB [Thermodesulfovibrionales bacterium]